LGQPCAVILAFLRVTTNPRIFERPFGVATASRYVDEWLDHPLVKTIAWTRPLADPAQTPGGQRHRR
jgi:hypothetical protein